MRSAASRRPAGLTLLNEASLRIRIRTDEREAQALYEALKVEASTRGAPFSAKRVTGGIVLDVSSGDLKDARAYCNSLLRLLKAARGSIQAVERSER